MAEKQPQGSYRATCLGCGESKVVSKCPDGTCNQARCGECMPKHDALKHQPLPNIEGAMAAFYTHRYMPP